MRIISGTHGGRRISPPSKMPYTRPTTDIAKEGLFNILQHSINFEGIDSLDLFGGTGSITYELASRGANQLTIVEKDVQMHAFIKKTVEVLGFENIQVLKSDVFKYMDQCNRQFDFIFAGPPYALTTIDDLPRKVAEKKLLKKNGWFVLEHTPKNNYKNFPLYRSERNYGTTIFSIFVQE